MRWHAPVIAGVLLATFSFFFLNALRHRAVAQPEPFTPQPAPSFRLNAVTGTGAALSLAELRGRPVVLNFWATWCEACQQEHGLLQHAATVFDGQVYFVGVVVGEGAEAARRFLQLYGHTYPQLLDADGHVAEAFGVAGFPETVFIDAHGVVRERRAGSLTFTELSQAIEPLLAHATPPAPGE